MSFGADLYWLPLGAGDHWVRLNGRAYEAVAAAVTRRARRDLYHSALVVNVPNGRFVIEQSGVPDGNGRERGVVGEGAVGSRWAQRLRLFRYEVRRWRDGVIADLPEAVASPCRVADDAAVAERLLDLVPVAPLAVWGRDEQHAGEMWNSNSLISWLIVSAGLDIRSALLPPGGRAPGWDAGIAVAHRARGYASPRGKNLFRHHLRLPDERARLGADQGSAGRARAGGGA